MESRDKHAFNSQRSLMPIGIFLQQFHLLNSLSFVQFSSLLEDKMFDIYIYIVGHLRISIII